MMDLESASEAGRRARVSRRTQSDPVSKLLDGKGFFRSKALRLPPGMPVRMEGAGLGLLPSKVVRDTMGLPVTLGRIGSLEVRLATTKKEIRKAQRLRFKVFYGELSAAANPASFVTRRDKDDFDYVCDHLLVIDHDPPKRLAKAPFIGKAAVMGKAAFGKAMLKSGLGKAKVESGKSGAGKSGAGKALMGKRPKVVGTYRLLRQDVAERNFGFYTSAEYDIDGIIAAHPGLRFLELGRSCVLKPYRNKRTVELLWHGIWTYILHHRIDVVLGCASLEGTDPARLAKELSFLHHFAAAPPEWRARAVPSRYVSMDRIPKDQIDAKAALQDLPPLVKGYLRLGARFGDGAVVDRQFGTTDVFVTLKVTDIGSRYINYYGSDASRHAA